MSHLRDEGGSRSSHDDETAGGKDQIPSKLDYKWSWGPFHYGPRPATQDLDQSSREKKKRKESVSVGQSFVIEPVSLNPPRPGTCQPVN